jgi:hypothetical protein
VILHFRTEASLYSSPRFPHRPPYSPSSPHHRHQQTNRPAVVLERAFFLFLFLIVCRPVEISGIAGSLGSLGRRVPVELQPWEPSGRCRHLRIRTWQKSKNYPKRPSKWRWCRCFLFSLCLLPPLCSYACGLLTTPSLQRVEERRSVVSSTSTAWPSSLTVLPVTTEASFPQSSIHCLPWSLLRCPRFAQ